jgi:hypothetical protein
VGIDKTLDIHWPKTQNCATTTETDDRNPRTAPGCMIANPRPRYAEHVRDIVQAQQRESVLWLFRNHVFPERPFRLLPILHSQRVALTELRGFMEQHPIPLS